MLNHEKERRWQTRQKLAVPIPRMLESVHITGYAGGQEFPCYIRNSSSLSFLEQW